MKSTFGSKELERCLVKLGFSKKRSPGSSHKKYLCPKKVSPGVRPFIIVILGRKTYDPHTQSSYIRQIIALGYSKEELTANLD